MVQLAELDTERETLEATLSYFAEAMPAISGGLFRADCEGS